VVSPRDTDGGLWINQDARMALAHLEAGKEISFTPAFAGNGVYLFVIEGEVTIDGKKLGKRDALGISSLTSFTVLADQEAELLAIEVPMFA
jgi:redox-sensitive bicupin YhaK (pirin superfamily)